MTKTRPLGTSLKAFAGGSILALTLMACGATSGPQAATTVSNAATTVSGAATTVTGGAATVSSAATTVTGGVATVSSAATAAAPTISSAATTISGAATTVSSPAPIASSTPVTSASPASGSAATPAASGTRYTIDPSKSKATYRVNETFINQNNRFNTAEGSTNAISGDLMIDKQNPSRSTIGTITIDISKLDSGTSQRDNAIRNRWLESTKYPNATFVTKRLEGLPTTPYTEGQELTFKIIGDLTIRTVTKEVTFDAKGKIVGNIFTGTATTKFNMTDFGFDPPDVAGIVKAENGVELILTIEAKQP